MRKAFLSFVLAVMLFVIAGCGTNNQANDIKLTSEAPESTETPAEAPTEPPTSIPPALSIKQRLGNVVKDAYTGIEIDAFIRERKAILPGFAIPVTVVVRNTGDETIDYVQGSGSYQTPEAVFIGVDGLQAVLPKDHLGPTTLDFRTQELKPGDELEFTMYVMAIEPDPNFDTYSIEMYSDNERYIAEQEWQELQEEFPDLIPAASGSYQGHAYFIYYVRGESGASDFTTEPTGYAQYDFQISVS